MNKQEQIIAKQNISVGFEELLDKFDFETVRKIMISLKWTWGFQEAHTPDEKEMKKSVLELFNCCMQDFDFTKQEICSSGGFEVSIYSDGSVELKFIAVNGEYNMDLQETFV